MDFPVIGDLVRYFLALVRKLPLWILRRRWPPKRIIEAVNVTHFDGPPQLSVGAQRSSHDLEFGGVCLFNFTPLTMAIVAAELQFSLNSQEFGRDERRLPMTIEVLPYARSGYSYRVTLPGPLVQRLRELASDYAMLRVDGVIIVATVHGDLRLPVQKDVAAIIGRDRPRETR